MLGNSGLYNVIDVTSAYHQIDIVDEDKKKTAFSTPDGHYEYNKMPFGLSNAPSTYQRFMNMLFSGLINELCMVYLDDIINVEEHLSKLAKVFDRLREANVKL